MPTGPLLATAAADVPRARWPLGQGARVAHALVVVLLLMTSFPMLAVFAALLHVDLKQALSPGPVPLGLLSLVTAYRAAVVVLGVRVWGRVPLSELGFRGDRPVRSIALGLAGAVVAVLVTGLLAHFLFGEPTEEIVATVTGFSARHRVAFAMIGLDAGLLEEGLFRGYLQPALAKKLGYPAGLLLTSLVFAVYHLKLVPVVLLAKVVLGLIFGVLRGQDRPIWASVIAHGLLWFVVGTL
jgi:membrane protease YdiL (CAAX protease family)